MRTNVLLRPLALSTFLFVAACGGAGTTNDANVTAAANETLDNLDEAVPESENVADLVALPAAPADAPAAETAPLTQAAQIAGEIDGGTGVERVPYEGGWAWRGD